MKNKILNRSEIRSTLILVVTLLFMGLLYFLTEKHPLSWKLIESYKERLIAFNREHSFLTPFFFITLYIFYALTCLPGIFAFSLMAGFLFDQPFSTIYVVSAATIGAVLFYLLARSAFGKEYYEEKKTIMSKFEGGFKKNEGHYLLFLRLIPLFPYGIINLAAAYFGVKITTFAWTTFLGMIPSVFVYTEAGKGLFNLLNSKNPLSPESFLNSELIIALSGLALLSLTPLLYKRLKNGRADS